LTETVGPINDWTSSFWGKLTEGFNLQYEGGAAAAFGLGFKQSTSIAADMAYSSGGMSCSLVVTSCLLAGPIVGGEVFAGGSVSSGKLNRGDVSWSVGVLGTWTSGFGILKYAQVANDGGIQAGVSEIAGGMVGAAIQVCRQQVAAQGCKWLKNDYLKSCSEVRLFYL
jgi:hypothetical protein